MPVLCNSFVTVSLEQKKKEKKKKKKNQEKYIQKARLFCLCTGSGFGKLQPTLSV